MRLLTTIADFVRQYHYFHGTMHRLQGLSDRQLADMGLERGDLARVAWSEAERRIDLDTRTLDRPYRKFEAGSLELAFAGQR